MYSVLFHFVWSNASICSVLQYVYDCFTYMVEYASKYQFPKPTFIDLIKFEEDDSMEDAFVLHYKNASNGNAWQSDEYNALKTEALNRVLGGN